VHAAGFEEAGHDLERRKVRENVCGLFKAEHRDLVLREEDEGSVVCEAVRAGVNVARRARTSARPESLDAPPAGEASITERQVEDAIAGGAFARGFMGASSGTAR
jgi:hypothetical protein